MHRYPVLSLICMLLLPLSVTAQIDSLRKECRNPNDSLRADAYLKLGKFYITQLGNADSLISNSRKAFAIAGKRENKTQVYLAQKQIAAGYMRLGDTANALLSLKTALDAAEQLKDSTYIADILHVHAVLYVNVGMNDVALDYLTREAEIGLAINYYNATAVAYSSIASVYRGQNQYEKMLLYHRKALRIIDKMELTIPGNIAQVYRTASQSYLLVGDKLKDTVLVDSSKVLADSVLAVGLRYNLPASQASAYYVYALYAGFYQRYEETEAYALKALEFRAVMEKHSQLMMYTAVAEACAHLKNPARALLYLDSAQKSPALNERYFRRHLAEVEWKIYKSLGNYEAALKAHERYMLLSDSLNGVDARNALDEIEQKFNKAENEREIQRLANEQEISSLNNKLLTAGIAGAILLALIIFLVARQRRLKSEQQRLITEQRLNRARMDPHFLFNTFTALQSFVLKEKDPVKAAGFLSDYSVIMRQTLESTFEETITIEEETAYLEKYLSLQQVRMSGKFAYSISVADEIDPGEMRLPGMIVQPFVENSVEHGFSGIDYPGEITIRFSIDKGMLSIVIDDNGIGLSAEKTQNSHTSRATSIINDQLILLNKKYGSDARYSINKHPDHSGTRVHILLPLIT